MQSLLHLTGEEFEGKVVRTTNETPRRVSLIDIISVVTGNKNPHQTLHDLVKLHPEALQRTETFKFPGRGQQHTPVTDARGLVTVINLMSGQSAAKFRAASADVVVRYLGGDETLIAELRQNRDVQADLPASHPLKIFEEDVKATGDGVTGHIMAGVYLARYGDKLIVEVAEGHEVLGYGYTDDVSTRRTQHARMYGGCDILDFCPTYNRQVETLFGKAMHLQNRSLKGKVDGEDKLVGELFAVKSTQDDYDSCRDTLWDLKKANPHPLESGQVSENDVRLEQAKADRAKAEAVTAKAVAITEKYKYLQCRLRKKRQRDSNQVQTADETPTENALQMKINRDEPSQIEPCVQQMMVAVDEVSFRIPKHKPTHTPVRQYNVNGTLVGEYLSAGEAAASHVKLHTADILKCVNGERDLHLGFRWSKTPKEHWQTNSIVATLNRTGCVVQRRPDGTFVNSYTSVSAAAKIIRVHVPTIRTAIGKSSECQLHLWSIR